MSSRSSDLNAVDNANTNYVDTTPEELSSSNNDAPPGPSDSEAVLSTSQGNIALEDNLAPNDDMSPRTSNPGTVDVPTSQTNIAPEALNDDAPPRPLDPGAVDVPTIDQRHAFIEWMQVNLDGNLGTTSKDRDKSVQRYYKALKGLKAAVEAMPANSSTALGPLASLSITDTAGSLATNIQDVLRSQQERAARGNRLERAIQHLNPRFIAIAGFPGFLSLTLSVGLGYIELGAYGLAVGGTALLLSAGLAGSDKQLLRTLEFYSQQLTLIEALPSSVHPLDAVANRGLDVRSAGFDYIALHIRSRPKTKGLIWKQRAHYRAEDEMRKAVKKFNETLSEFVLKF